MNGRVADLDGDPLRPAAGASATGHPAYSREWSASGPIIERQHISLEHDGVRAEPWLAAAGEPITYADGSEATRILSGRTPLIAAMRCYVASKLGKEQL
jgi:hypothetical protein